MLSQENALALESGTRMLLKIMLNAHYIYSAKK